MRHLWNAHCKIPQHEHGYPDFNLTTAWFILNQLGILEIEMIKWNIWRLFIVARIVVPKLNAHQSSYDTQVSFRWLLMQNIQKKKLKFTRRSMHQYKEIYTSNFTCRSKIDWVILWSELYSSIRIYLLAIISLLGSIKVL